MELKILILASLVLLSASSLAQELDRAEQEVWDRELAYYEFARTNDPDSFLSLFHDNVIGWPSLDELPKGKSQVSLWIPMVHSNNEEVWQYELDRQAIQSFGDVVIVQYLLRDFFISANTGAEIRSDTYKISHTWQKSEGEWKIIAGMGGILP